MPNIYSLWQDGVKFSRFYTAASDCTPARATLVTGLYAYQTYSMVTRANPNNPTAVAQLQPQLSADFPTYGKLLRDAVSGDNEVGRSATNSLAGWVSAGVPGADAQGPGDAGTTDESPTQPVHGETTRWQQPRGCRRSGGHFSAQCPPD